MRALILRGPVETWYSPTAPYPKLHVVRECDGLRHVVGPEGLVFDDVFSLAEAEGTRPCRMCLLESVLYSVLRPKAPENRQQPVVWATFTSQAVPDEPGANLARYKWRHSTESGEARLKRVAARFKLAVGRGDPGLVAHGFLPRRGAAILARNLRTVVREDVAVAPPTPQVEAFWTFTNDAPPELGGGAVDPWETAALVS